MSPRRKRLFLYKHSLSIITLSILALWIALYSLGDPHTHWGSLFGNAVADWSGVAVTVMATKYFYEKGSAESRKPHDAHINPMHRRLKDHSLTIFLVITGIGWALLYWRMDSEGKWGEVVGNVVSEWTQLCGTVLLTKYFIEQGSKESRGKQKE